MDQLAVETKHLSNCPIVPNTKIRIIFVDPETGEVLTHSDTPVVVGYGEYKNDKIKIDANEIQRIFDEWKFKLPEQFKLFPKPQGYTIMYNGRNIFIDVKHQIVFTSLKPYHNMNNLLTVAGSHTNVDIKEDMVLRFKPITDSLCGYNSNSLKQMAYEKQRVFMLAAALGISLGSALGYTILSRSNQELQDWINITKRSEKTTDRLGKRWSELTQQQKEEQEDIQEIIDNENMLAQKDILNLRKALKKGNTPISKFRLQEEDSTPVIPVRKTFRPRATRRALPSLDTEFYVEPEVNDKEKDNEEEDLPFTAF